MSVLEPSDAFAARHIGTAPDEQAAMLDVLGYRSRAALMDAIVPATIRRRAPLGLPAALTEAENRADAAEALAEERLAILRKLSFGGYLSDSIYLTELVANHISAADAAKEKP